jgi:hypothetical protein
MTSTAAGPRYGQPDQVSARHWRQAHVDPEKVRAWHLETKGQPAPRGPISDALRETYLAERADEIPLPGHPTREEAYAALPILTRTYVAWLGGLQVTYGPCPRCRRPTAAPTGEPLPLCMHCQTSAAARLPSPPARPGLTRKDGRSEDHR